MPTNNVDLKIALLICFFLILILVFSSVTNFQGAFWIWKFGKLLTFQRKITYSCWIYLDMRFPGEERKL